MKPVSDARPLEAAKKWSFGQGEATGRITHQSAIKTTFLLYKATVSAIGVE
jgi:hypothetical protein